MVEPWCRTVADRYPTPSRQTASAAATAQPLRLAGPQAAGADAAAVSERLGNRTTLGSGRAGAPAEIPARIRSHTSGRGTTGSSS